MVEQHVEDDRRAAEMGDGVGGDRVEDRPRLDPVEADMQAARRR